VILASDRSRWAKEMVVAAAAVANYCDHVEHNEVVELVWVTDSAKTLRKVACEAAAAEGVDLQMRYAERLRAIEARNPISNPDTPDGGEAAEVATNWRALQLAQVAHDRYYHSDVIGLSKADQLRHYALHCAKLAGAYAELAADELGVEDFRARRLPDTLLFGLKLATVTGKRLPETALVGGKEASAAVYLSAA
jgi:hypothetical protein